MFGKVAAYRRFYTLAVTIVVLLLPVLSPAQSVDKLDSALFDSLHYRHIGPVGNRVSAIVGVPGDRNTYYFGAASGGVFKSTDGGVHWTPIFDDQPVAAIGALAIAPSDPNVVWAGTGEAFIRSNVVVGNGVYRSTDAGKSWQHRGLDKTGRIGRIVIHPTNPDIVLVAALGHAYGPQQERGVYRTEDGGATWQRVLFVDENTGASDIVMDPNNPRILFAGMWQMVIHTWGRTSGGPGSGLHMSRDGGKTWVQLQGNGLPKPPWGKIGLAMTPADSNRVYALIETNSNREFEELEEHQGVLWRSDDGGDNWKMVNAEHAMAQRPLYYTRMAVAPDDADELHFVATAHTASLDGGKTVERGSGGGGDHHDIWIDPLLPDRVVLAHDQGLRISNNRGKSWWRPQLPIAQMYHAFTDNEVPYNVYGNRQDGGSARGPSNSLTGDSIPIGAWQNVGGCESGFAVPDPEDSNIAWSGCYEGILERYDHRTRQARNVMVWPDNPEGWPAGELKYRFQWTFPITISPHDHNRVYVGSQHVHRTTNGGQSWEVISPDLTTNDKTKQERTGGLTPDDVSPTYGAVLFAIAESPVTEGVLWAGSNDGLIHITRDNGANWTNVTANIRDLPPLGTVSNIEASRYDAGTAYVAFDFHQVNIPEPYLYKTTNYGKSWKRIDATIPRTVLSYTHVIREDPKRPGLLYAGLGNAVYFSLNDGANWHALRSNLPPAPVHWLTVQEHFNDLVLATYGRGFWILDDITPLQQLTNEVLGAGAHLFDPRPAYRFRFREPAKSQPEDSAAGENPEYGASVNYYLKEKSDAKLALTILDSAGAVVRSFKAGKLPKQAGLNRVYWDLRSDTTDEPKVRTSPDEHAHVKVPAKGWRAPGDGRPYSLLVAPGAYTVKLAVGEKEFTSTLEVRKDPGSAGTLEDVQAQAETLQEIRGMTNRVVKMINEVEWARKQLADLRARLDGREDAKEVLTAGEALEKKLRELEYNFFDLRLTGGLSRQDTIRWPRRLYAKLASLAGYIGKTDFRPTDQQLEVLGLYRKQLEDYSAQFKALQENDVAAFNQLLAQNGVSGIVLSGSD